MSSCFLCDTSYDFDGVRDDYYVTFSEGRDEKFYMKQLPIMIGSTSRNGEDEDLDQQHTNNKSQNYVSYRVKRIEFRSSIYERSYNLSSQTRLSYVLIFKVPFRNPIFDYYFRVMPNFMLYSEPESVLKYGVYKWHKITQALDDVKNKFSQNFDLIVDKPFIVGPNDYVGVLYMFAATCKVDSSAKVFFDVV